MLGCVSYAQSAGRWFESDMRLIYFKLLFKIKNQIYVKIYETRNSKSGSANQGFNDHNS